jgi:hypothetical protein
MLTVKKLLSEPAVLLESAMGVPPDTNLCFVDSTKTTLAVDLPLPCRGK